MHTHNNSDISASKFNYQKSVSPFVSRIKTKAIYPTTEKDSGLAAKSSLERRSVSPLISSKRTPSISDEEKLLSERMMKRALPKIVPTNGLSVIRENSKKYVLLDQAKKQLEVDEGKLDILKKRTRNR